MATELFQRFETTLLLAVTALVIIIVISFSIGIWSARKTVDGSIGLHVQLSLQLPLCQVFGWPFSSFIQWP